MTFLFGGRPERTLEDARWLRAFARRLVADEHDAEDLGQDVLAAAVAAPPARGVDRPWLAAVARNLAASLRRRRRRSADGRRAQGVPAPRPAPSAAELVAEAELQRRAVTAALALPEPYRETVLLRFLRGMSLADVARATGAPVETVRTRQRRALAMLRAELEPRDGRGVLASLGLFGLRSGGVVLMVKKAVGVGVAAAALLVAWWLWPAARGEGVGPAAAATPDVRNVAAEVPAEAEPDAVEEVDRTAVPVTGEEVAASERAGALTVEVRWEDDGSPAAGCPVRLAWRMRPAGRIVRTDADGRVVFDGLGGGEHTLRMLQGNVYRKVAIAAGEMAREVVTIPRGHRMKGVVVDPDGVPVPGAEIVAIQGGTDPQRVFAIGRADGTGRFSVEGLGGLDLVGARSARLGTSDFVLIQPELRGGDEPRELRLVLPGNPAALRGRIVDARNVPVAGAWVRLGEYSWKGETTDGGSAVQEPPGRILTSDGDGTFACDMLRPGAQRLRIYARGFQPHEAEIELVPYRTRELVVVLREGAILSGVVRDADGRPVGGADVDLEGGWYPAPTGARTDAAGAFSLSDLPTGVECAFTVRASGFAFVERTFAFAAGERTTWDVELAQGLTLRGRLVDARGEPLAGWWIGSDRHRRRAKTGADGRFVFPACEAAAHALSVRRSFGFEPIVTTFEGVFPRDGVQELAVPDRAMPSATVRGRCVTADGVPLVGISVELKQGEWPVIPGQQVVRTDDEGRFETPEVPPGRYSLQPFHAEHRFDAVEVELAAEERRDVGELRALGR